MNFILIKNLCEEDYFNNCFEVLCDDYCDSNIINNDDDCYKKCTNVVNLLSPLDNELKKISSSYNKIIDKHTYYSNKYKNNPELSSLMNKHNTSINNRNSTGKISQTNSSNNNKNLSILSNSDINSSQINEIKSSIQKLKLEVINKERQLLKLLK